MEIDYFMIALIGLALLALISIFMLYKIIKLAKRNKELYILSRRQQKGLSDSNNIIKYLRQENQTLKERIELLISEDKHN